VAGVVAAGWGDHIAATASPVHPLQHADPVAAAGRSQVIVPATRGVPETGHWSCCAFVFVDQAAEDIAAVDLFGGWRSRYCLVL
jgi:hypothetical protein